MSLVSELLGNIRNSLVVLHTPFIMGANGRIRSSTNTNSPFYTNKYTYKKLTRKA